MEPPFINNLPDEILRDIFTDFVEASPLFDAGAPSSLESTGCRSYAAYRDALTDSAKLTELHATTTNQIQKLARVCRRWQAIVDSEFSNLVVSSARELLNLQRNNGDQWSRPRRVQCIFSNDTDISHSHKALFKTTRLDLIITRNPMHAFASLLDPFDRDHPLFAKGTLPNLQALNITWSDYAGLIASLTFTVPLREILENIPQLLSLRLAGFSPLPAATFTHHQLQRLCLRLRDPQTRPRHPDDLIWHLPNLREFCFIWLGDDFHNGCIPGLNSISPLLRSFELQCRYFGDGFRHFNLSDFPLLEEYAGAHPGAPPFDMSARPHSGSVGTGSRLRRLVVKEVRAMTLPPHFLIDHHSGLEIHFGMLHWGKYHNALLANGLQRRRGSNTVLGLNLYVEDAKSLNISAYDEDGLELGAWAEI